MKRANLTGRTFNYLKVLDDSGGEKVLCRCLLCNNTKNISRASLIRGTSKSCGCLRKITGKANAKNLSDKKDLTGKLFPGVEVLGKTDQRKGTQIVYECKCLHCGKIFYTCGVNLTRGDTKSCGCQKIKLSTEHLTKDCIDGTKISSITHQKPMRSNTSGVTGVAPCKSGWIAYIGFKGKRYVLYRGDDKQAAIQKRKEAEKKLFGDFLNGYSGNNQNQSMD